MTTTTQRVKEIRNEIKKLFPDFKISVTKDHWSGVNIDILEAPVLLTEKSHVQVNHYYLNSNYTGKALEILTKINSIANEGVTYRETGDYGTQPSFYVNINIGQWNKPFKYILTDSKNKAIVGIKIKSLKKD